MPLRRPFVYIASLRRTGSTMIAQLLSKPPVAFIFREPRLGLGKLRVRPEFASIFASCGVDLLTVKRRMRDLPIDQAFDAFLEFVEQVAPKTKQLGIKEITHTGWEEVSKRFADMKVIVTVRDPRDIYLSLYERRRNLLHRGKLWFETHTLLPYLRTEYANMCALMERHEHMIVRYEDLCSDPRELERVREFVRSPVKGRGLLGTGEGRSDIKKHGSEIDASRVRVFEQIDDEVARHNAAYVFEQMRDYAERFGYAR